MEVKISFVCNDDCITVQTTDEREIFVEINYSPDMGSGERGEAILFKFEEFEMFLFECKRLLEFAKSRKEEGHG